MSAYADFYRQVSQQQASELPLNAFGGGHALPTYPQRGAQKDDAIGAACDMVQSTHDHSSPTSHDHWSAGDFLDRSRNCDYAAVGGVR